MDNFKKKEGFSLIELVIALAIIAILVLISMPSYFNYVMRSRRTEGINALNSIQLEEEKYRGQNTTYGTLADVWGGVTSTENGYYSLSATNNTATGYTLTATAQGSQANDTQNGVSCSTLTLTVNGLNTTRTPQACWSQ
ncbi:type IV pilin protein [Fluoribacter gormanii]|uniref:Serogroup C1 n=1 Tax=Fluoribacter gormanii TaxID=464 RepID=A0A377GHR0_9GAMM|nr:type IV pilin protein [Fluoribacter gormanii]KTD02209.1 Type-IV pilin [Fluoribacter gormanii]MCW8444394.1 prepilin-type N-terminal cleavage/methylation domain-containing protein [Fluoribacter gormanii]SIR53068.1 type IV pilus assembly protein PilE [Fluoribacter gormanii]STO24085.1 Serogroup C1 [Fluoribacter gormanii]